MASGYYITLFSSETLVKGRLIIYNTARSVHASRKGVELTDDLTVPLTHVVPEGEAALLDAFRLQPSLSIEERWVVEDVVRLSLLGLLERLPVGTPEAVVDRVCDLLADVKDLLGLPNQSSPVQVLYMNKLTDTN